MVIKYNHKNESLKMKFVLCFFFFFHFQADLHAFKKDSNKISHIL